MKNQRGFTLTELMIAIAVSGILLNIAVPSFQNVIEANSVNTATNTLYSSILSARAEALRAGKNLVVCQSDDEETCGDYASGTTSWNSWVIRALDSSSKSALNLDNDKDRLVYVQNADAFTGVNIRFSAGRALMVDSRSQLRIEESASKLAFPANSPYFLICGQDEDRGYSKAVVINAIGQPIVIDKPVGDITMDCTGA